MKLDRRHLVLFAGLLAACHGSGTLVGAFPDPRHSPEDVVRFQVEALGQNDASDTGIEITFRFASPANKRVTGPLDRFVRLVRNPAYSPMLGHSGAEYGAVMERDGYAAQLVKILAGDGSTRVYLFELSRQESGPLAGCWMTDGVQLVEVEPAEEAGLAI